MQAADFEMLCKIFESRRKTQLILEKSKIQAILRHELKFTNIQNLNLICSIVNNKIQGMELRAKLLIFKL